MARTVASLPAGSRITDYISLGVIAKFFPVQRIESILKETGKASVRKRDLPAHVVLYYVIALALYMRASYREVLRCLLEGLQWLLDPSPTLKVAGKSGISQARTRLGSEPVKKLYQTVVTPMATEQTQGAWYRGWRLVSLDGSTLDVADTAENEAAFGRPAASRGSSAYPQIRFVALLESGTHVLTGAQMAGCRTDETALAKQVIPRLQKGMLCLADRYYLGYELWRKAEHRRGPALASQEERPSGHRETFARRVLSEPDLSVHRRSGPSAEGYGSPVEYRLEGIPGAEPLYRLVTTILDHRPAPAKELAALYQERWEIETTLDELKTHLRGARIVLRSKTPDLVRQEFYGLLLAHFAIRGLMHEAALQAKEDPDRLSFVHAVHVVQRRLPRFVAIPPSAQKSIP